jgi:hypothetical protein
VNGAANDFCPTLAPDGHTFFFVSNRDGACGQAPGGASNDDMYVTWTWNSSFSGNGPFFQNVRRLDCADEGGPNSSFAEHSPFPILERHNGLLLYYSSTRTGSGDIYFSKFGIGGFGQGQLVPGTVNTAAIEGQPNVRKDGKEIFFFRNVAASPGINHDIHSATRESTKDAWSEDMNLGLNVNSAANETRPSLSWDGHTLYFGSTRTGGGDHYYTTR